MFDHSNCRDLKRDVPEGYTALGFRDRNDVESVLVRLLHPKQVLCGFGSKLFHTT